MYKVPFNVKNIIPTVEKHYNDSVITCNTVVTLITNTLNNILYPILCVKNMLQNSINGMVKATISSSDILSKEKVLKRFNIWPFSLNEKLILTKKHMINS